MQTEALSGVVKGGGKDEEEKLKEFMKRVSGMMLSQLNNNANSKAFRGFFILKKLVSLGSSLEISIILEYY